MWRRAVWFWPLFFAVPLALVVVIDANRSATSQAQWLRSWATVLFSYAFFYFALSWPVWLTQLSRVKQLVVSALVPVGVLLILAVLPLNRPMDLAALQSHVPRLSKEKLVGGQLLDLRLEPDGGFMAYGTFTAKNNREFNTIRLRFNAAGEPDLSSPLEVRGLESYAEAITRDADGRLFISHHNSRQKQPVLFALTADGQPDEAFQTRLLETQRAHGLPPTPGLTAMAVSRSRCSCSFGPMAVWTPGSGRRSEPPGGGCSRPGRRVPPVEALQLLVELRRPGLHLLGLLEEGLGGHREELGLVERAVVIHHVALGPPALL